MRASFAIGIFLARPIISVPPRTPTAPPAIFSEPLVVFPSFMSSTPDLTATAPPAIAPPPIIDGEFLPRKFKVADNGLNDTFACDAIS